MLVESPKATAGPSTSYHSSSQLIMFRITLPSYTAERYYLLSEIEEKSRFISLDYPEESSVAHSSNPGHVAVYLLFDARKGRESLLQHIQRARDYIKVHINVLASKMMLAVEVFHDQPLSSDTVTKIEEVFQDISLSWQELDLLVFGISDNAGGTCALEVVMDFCHVVAPNEGDQIDLVCLSKQSFLGLEIDLEPDAISGVQQYLLASKPAPLTDWMNTLTYQVSEEEKKQAIQTKREADTIIQYQSWIYILAIAMLLVSASLYIFIRSS